MKKKFNTTLNAEVVEALKIQSIKENKSASAIIEELLKTYLKVKGE